MKRTGSGALIALLCMVCSLAAAQEWPKGLPGPYEARYVLYRDGDLAGRGAMALRHLGGNRYQNASVTEATKGVAGLLGGKAGEISTWELVSGRPQSVRYQYEQEVAFSNRKREAHFNYETSRVYGVNKGDAWDLRLEDGANDRLLANFLLIADVANGKQEMSYNVAERGRYKEYRFTRTDTESISTPLGDFQAVRVERQHSDPKRKTISWHAPEYAYLPIRIVHIDDDETLQLDIESVSFD